jgi:hypothetical protein
MYDSYPESELAWSRFLPRFGAPGAPSNGSSKRFGSSFSAHRSFARCERWDRAAEGTAAEDMVALPAVALGTQLEGT